MSVAISIEDLAVKRGKNQIIDGLSLELPKGKIIGLLGPSGAGKTTLMRVLVGVQANVKGKAVILGHEAGSHSLDVLVSYDTQSSSVFDDLTVEQNLDFARKMLNVPKSRIAKTIEQVGLQGQAKQRVGSLSGGQRSRASLAVALLGEPEVIVLDEPTVGLDPVLRADLWQIFRNLADDGKTLVVSSHVMDEAERCDFILFVRDGKVIAHDTLANILKTTNTNSAENAFLHLAKAGN
ncbi:MAG: ABC transporter ATP-binding protein [Micrococcales bacterium]